jgi:hypothetical protein
LRQHQRGAPLGDNQKPTLLAELRVLTYRIAAAEAGEPRLRNCASAHVKSRLDKD